MGGRYCVGEGERRVRVRERGRVRWEKRRVGEEKTLLSKLERNKISMCIHT